jgi:hypothetical protein
VLGAHIELTNPVNLFGTQYHPNGTATVDQADLLALPGIVNGFNGLR